jgi:hypothetical protein
MGLAGDALAGSSADQLAAVLDELAAGAREVLAGLHRAAAAMHPGWRGGESRDSPFGRLTQGLADAADGPLRAAAAPAGVGDQRPDKVLGAIFEAARKFVEGVEALSRSEGTARWALETCAGRLASRLGLDDRVEEYLIDARESIKLDKIALFESVDEGTKKGLLELRDLKKIDEIMEEYTALDEAGGGLGIDAHAGREANADAGGVAAGVGAPQIAADIDSEYAGHADDYFDH